MVETADGLPALLPARMLNEFVYCLRLFYPEWVDHRWADNDDTAQGSFVHRRVDPPGPALPSAEDIPDLFRSHSVQLDDAEIGLTAIIDRVDHSDGTVSPVDMKKGSPTPDGAAWPADEMQLLVQAVLLRRAGYLVEAGSLYYASANRRVEVPIPSDAEARVVATTPEARELAARPCPPLPLIESPKCPRWSLVSLCLPDEVNQTLQRSTLPPRYVELRRRQIIVHGQGGPGIAAAMIAGKIRNSRTLPMRNSREVLDPPVAVSLKELERAVPTAPTRAATMGHEGTAARLYFERFSGMLRPEVDPIARQFSLLGRNRRPPRDPVNCPLSFCFGLLVKDLVAVCLAVGLDSLDPFIGVLHSPRFGRPSLALDLAEEFRPLIGDSVVLQVLNNGEVGEGVRSAVARSDADPGGPPGRHRRVRTPAGRPGAASGIRLPDLLRISYRRVLDVQARLLAAVMVGETPAYTQMTTG